MNSQALSDLIRFILPYWTVSARNSSVACTIHHSCTLENIHKLQWYNHQWKILHIYGNLLTLDLLALLDLYGPIPRLISLWRVAPLFPVWTNFLSVHTSQCKTDCLFFLWISFHWPQYRVVDRDKGQTPVVQKLYELCLSLSITSVIILIRVGRLLGLVEDGLIQSL